MSQNRVQRSNSEINLSSFKNAQKFFETRQKTIETYKNNVTISKKKQSLIINLLKEVLYNSLAQALIKIVLTPFKCLKLFTFLVVIGASGMAFYLVIQSIMDYFSFEVSTKFRIINENPSLFPKVTFCNINRFTTEYAYNLTLKNITNGNNLSNEDKQKLGHDLNDILFECKFNYNECNSKHFIWSYDDVFGNCYTFNSGFDSNGTKTHLIKSNIAGPDAGLNLKFYTNIYEKLLDCAFVHGLGALIRIGNSSYSTFYSNGGVFVQPGVVNYIAVERQFHSILPKPYSDCEIDLNSPKFIPNFDIYNLIGRSEYVYSQQLCFSQCAQNYLIQKYNCYLPIVLSLFNATECNQTISTFIFQNDNILETNFMTNVCQPVCSLECNRHLFNTFVTQVKLFARHYIDNVRENLNLKSDFMKRSLNEETIESSIVSVKIFYDSLTYLETIESPQMSIVSLLASVGGSLSLFLGVSFLSLCEIVEVILEIYFTLKIFN